MSHLSLHFLGAFQAMLDGKPITAFSSAKTRALLAYLAVESNRPHRRDLLATLLWPEARETNAHTNFRHTLSSLRKTIHDRNNSQNPFLHVSRETVQFNCTSDCWLDVRDFQDRVAKDNPDSRLEEAVALYRGEFLEGFFVRDSAAFEDWALLTRDRLRRQAVTALQKLVKMHAGQGDFELACTFAWRWVELEPWQEIAYQHLMRVLAVSGQRTAALAQYEVCCNILHDEFDVKPSGPTIRLYRQIRDGVFASPLSNAQEITAAQTFSQPGVLAQSGQEDNSFVGRKEELERLEGALHASLDGHGRVNFITGEAGQGKTALLQAFVKQAQHTVPNLIIANGNCNAYTGIGDPYLPFREILEMLLISPPEKENPYPPKHLHRDDLALVYRNLLTDGPDLVNIFFPAATLLQQANTLSTNDGEWLDFLKAHIERKNAVSEGGSLRQEDLFRQYASVLQRFAQIAPILLVIDDMQWADLGTISLLFHLGRHLVGYRILIVGAYRSEEVALGRNGERHPLEPLINEFTRTWGEITVDLEQADGNAFIQSFLNNEPNLLNAQFHKTLYRQTRGHPLFTIELLRGMQERGDLVKNGEGRWVEGPVLNWEVLPARVEAVIAERVQRLSHSCIDTLRIASVEGEVFTAEVISQIQNIPDDALVSTLSGVLNRTHRMVSAQSVDHTATQRLSRYRFRHILFQKYLYNSLDPVERARLHQKIGSTLLKLYGEQTETITPQLAWHFEQAGMVDEAVTYYHRAGERAMRMSAYAEAIIHLNKGIALLKTQPESPERDERELALQFAISVPIIAIRSWGAPEAIQAYDRALELSQSLNQTEQLLQALMLKQYGHTTRAEHAAALETAEQYNYLAKRSQDPLLMMLSHVELVVTCLFVGEFTRSLHHMRQLLAAYDLETHRSLAFVLGQDPAVTAQLFGFYDLWYLGYPVQALKQSQKALLMAQKLGHDFTLFFLQHFISRLHRWQGDIAEVEKLVEVQRNTWREHKMELAEAGALMDYAWVLTEKGKPKEAIRMYQEGWTIWHATGHAKSPHRISGRVSRNVRQIRATTGGVEVAC